MNPMALLGRPEASSLTHGTVPAQLGDPQLFKVPLIRIVFCICPKDHIVQDGGHLLVKSLLFPLEVVHFSGGLGNLCVNI